MTLLIDHVDCPIGDLLVISDGDRLCALDYAGYEDRMKRLLAPRFGGQGWHETDDPQGFSSRLRAYMGGEFAAVDDIPVDPGGTAFQARVWAALRTIPTGTTTSYGALAAKLGNANASRAVGLANSLNPIAIVIPCHRVVGANGTLTGYAGGLERKRWLLAHEGAVVDGDDGDSGQSDLFAT